MVTEGFFLVIGPERVKKTSAVKVKSLLGIMVKGSFVQPPRCEKCGGHIELGSDWEEGLAFCQDCGEEVRIFHYKDCPIRF